ncbi:MAG: hypothetical protein H7Z72_13235 [Bacteroidetes bacterium]|nr:hypothetical protein [Fibrella sp.]
MKVNLLLFMLLLLSFGCGQKEDTPVVAPIPVPGKLSTFVAPVITDAAITTYPDSHYVYLNRTVTARKKLLVFLPGAAAKPSFYKLFVETAGDLGYHALGLMYPNPAGAYNTEACASSTDANCFGKLRQETLDGTDQTPLIDVNPANSTLNRLAKLLAYLAKTYPSDAWRQYLDASGQPVWTNIVVAGHSQGAGHSGFMTKNYPLARAILLANKNVTGASQPVAWYALPNATGSNANVFGFTHSQDEFADQQIVWKALKLDGYGPVLNVDGRTSYNGSHTLTSNQAPASLPNSTLGFHSSVAVDRFTPRIADDSLIFGPVWTYLLTL